MTKMISPDEPLTPAENLGELPQSVPSGSAVEKSATPTLLVDVQSNGAAYFAGGIFLLLTLFALYFTGAIVIPVILAIGLYLTLKPVMRVAGKLRIPRVIAACLIIVMFFGGASVLGFALSTPAAEWVSKAPESLRRLESRLFFFKQPIANLQSVGQQVEKIAEPTTTGEAQPVKLAGPGLSSRLFSGTTSALIGLGTTITLLFFFLLSGDLFLRRFVEILPTFSNKKQAVEISREIERNISTYFMTITLMNLVVGILTGIVVYVCGLSDPVLWGTLVFVLNYVPIIGPLCGLGTLLLAGMLTFEPLWQAALPAGIYLLIHLLEGQFVTPMLLARRFTLNPVLVILSIIFWYWMWGVPGALLAVPLLATVKIVCDRIGPLMAIGHFLGGETRLDPPETAA